MSMRLRIRAAIFAALIFPAAAFAAVDVHFSTDDLAALIQLAKPNQTRLVLDGRAGRLVPGPSLLFVGLEPQKFDIDMKVGTIVDLRFNNLQAKSFRLATEGNFVRLDIAIEDQEKAIRSALGSISVKNAVLTAWIRLAGDGSTNLVSERVDLSGELKGTGLLKPRWVIDGVRKIALKNLREQVDRQLVRPKFQKAIEDGFVVWARFSQDERLTKVVRGTPAISADGLRFQAE